jgi:hypothetical protein
MPRKSGMRYRTRDAVRKHSVVCRVLTSQPAFVPAKVHRSQPGWYVKSSNRKRLAMDALQHTRTRHFHSPPLLLLLCLATMSFKHAPRSLLRDRLQDSLRWRKRAMPWASSSATRECQRARRTSTGRFRICSVPAFAGMTCTWTVVSVALMPVARSSTERSRHRRTAHPYRYDPPPPGALYLQHAHPCR